MEKAYWNWLISLGIFTRKQIKKLLDTYKTAGEIFAAPEKDIIKISGADTKVIEYLRSSKNKDWIEAYHKLENQGIHLVLMEDAEYPGRLRNIPDAPLWLYYMGQLPLEGGMAAAIVGARRCSRYGYETARGLGEFLGQNGIQVISGMAAGIDSAGQWGALSAGGYSAAVLGSGVDICYPSENRKLYDILQKDGCLISEFPPGSSPKPWHFPLRNRIISGLSDVVVVVEAREKSGSLITVDMALEQGKEVYAVPGRLTDALSKGCNDLIKNGAGMVTDFRVLLEEWGVFCELFENNRKKNKLALAEKENLLYSDLDLQPKNVETIIEETGLSYKETMDILISLQLAGLVAEIGIGHYALAGSQGFMKE